MTEQQQRRRFQTRIANDDNLSLRGAAWWRHHVFCAKDSLFRLVSEPLASLLTWMVIGIALVLPAILFITLNSIEDISRQWDNGTRISLYLNRNISESSAQKIAKELLARKDIVKADYVSTQNALAFFKENSGLGDALQYIDENPFPPSIEVQYRESLVPARVNNLIKELRSVRGVQSVDLDMDWVKRLFRFMELGKTLAMVLICLLSIGVLLVVGNTIRLAIESRRDEVVVTKLVGGTDAFVRRPFLYSGFWYGLGGGLIACLALYITQNVLQEPIVNLMELYNSSFSLLNMSVFDALGLIGLGVLLGWIGAWLAVSHHLSEIELQ